MKRRILLCSLDGVRPDGLQLADTPVVDALIRDGAVCWEGRTVMPSSTLPCHTSMLRGVDTARHGITTNLFQPLVRPVPSILEVAKEAGLTTGMFYNWEQLRDVASPGSLDVSVMWGDANSAAGDRHIAESAASYSRQIDFDLLFLYLGWPDECGHLHGWMSSAYLQAITHADRCLALVRETMRERGEVTSLVLSDHGGHERTHGTDCPEDMTIPWVLNGPGVKPGHVIREPVRIYDTCPTLAHLLGLKASREWDGHAIRDALTGD
jgi:predicted AlkP superfamily pyrophosphatase or phosphodiesterase